MSTQPFPRGSRMCHHLRLASLLAGVTLAVACSTTNPDSGAATKPNADVPSTTDAPADVTAPPDSTTDDTPEAENTPGADVTAPPDSTTDDTPEAENTPRTDGTPSQQDSTAGDPGAPPTTAELDRAWAEAAVESAADPYPEAVNSAGRELFLTAIGTACSQARDAAASGISVDAAAQAVLETLPTDPAIDDLQPALIRAITNYFTVGHCGENLRPLTSALTELEAGDSG